MSFFKLHQFGNYIGADLEEHEQDEFQVRFLITPNISGDLAETFCRFHGSCSVIGCNHGFYVQGDIFRYHNHKHHPFNNRGAERPKHVITDPLFTPTPRALQTRNAITTPQLS